jgi:hypothetical protein
MHRLLIISIHLLLAGFGAFEYCVSKGMRKFKYKSASHYSARIPYNHPAYQDIMISLTENRSEASLTSYTLCTSHGSRLPLLITGEITLN